MCNVYKTPLNGHKRKHTDESLCIYFIPNYIGNNNINTCNCKILKDKEAIDNERILKSLWMSEYSDDFFQTLLESENRRKHFSLNSVQISFRPSLLALMKIVTSKLHLSRITLHLAVYLLDGFMDDYNIIENKLNLIAIACLILASKIEETDVNQPKLSQVLELFECRYSLTEFKHFERKVLIHFKFHLICPTMVTFIEFYANRCVSLEDYETYLRNWRSKVKNSFTSRIEKKFGSYSEMIIMTRLQLLLLADLSLDCTAFFNSKPSLIAISCVVAVRRIYNIKPYWLESLPKLVEYSENSTIPIVDKLVKLYNDYGECAVLDTPCSCESVQSGVPCNSPDSGILSDSKSESDDDQNYCLDYPSIKRKRLC